MTTPFETAKRKPTVEDADYNHEVEAQNSDGNRGSWGYLDVLSDPSRFPYWWPRNNLPTYAPPKWGPKEGEDVWIVDVSIGDRKAFSCNYYDYHKELFERGMVYRTKEEAHACRDRMIQAAKGGE